MKISSDETLKVLICRMGSSTHNKTSQFYEITWFYPFNGVAMWKRKISIYKSFHKKYFLLFFEKIKTKQKVSGVARWKLKIYSKHLLNKAKTKRKKTKVVLGNKNIYPRQRCQKVFPPFTHLGHMAEIFKLLGASLGACLDSRLSPCSWLLHLGSTPNEAKGGRPY